MDVRRSLGFTRWGMEMLEERRLLAVGTFERTGGGVSAYNDVTAQVQTAQVIQDGPSVNGDVLAYSSATAQASDDGGFAFAHAESEAFIPVPTNGSISVPQHTVSGISQFQLVDEAYVSIDASDSFASGTYEYDPPPGGGDLVAVKHWFIAIYGGEVEIGDPTVSRNMSVYGEINDDWINAEYFGVIEGAETWRVSSNMFETYFSVGGVNLHLRKIDEDVPTDMLVQESLNLSADTETDELLSGIWSRAGTIWAYVDVETPSFDPGDFDGDGDVDEDDYAIWDAGGAQADAQINTITNGVLDQVAGAGVIDEDDYAVWSANVDGILVSTLTDESDGNYSYGDLSLREALLLAADGNHPGRDIIAFDESLFGGTITLNPSLGALNVSSEVSILGPGADQLTIDANGGNLMFNVGGLSSLESTIVNLKLTGTSTFGTAVNAGGQTMVLDQLEIVGNGWGVRPGGNNNVTISNSTISGNAQDGVARTSQSTNPTTGKLTITDSQITDNGRGVFIRNLDTEIINTEIAGNTGWGIHYESEETFKTLTVANSTIAENGSGGIELSDDAEAEIYNTTISSNDGVGMSVENATATLTNVTVTENRVASSSDTAGVYADSDGTIEMHNTIVAHNYAGPSGSEVLADLGKATTGSFSVGTSSYNMIGIVGNSGITSSQSNIILGSNDPGLMALGDYGGRTRTHALLFDSQAIDAGDNAKATALDLVFDQRGEGYDRIVDWDEDMTATVDIGAFEVAISEMFS